MIRIASLVLPLLLAQELNAQSARVDFRNDVLPIFREHCIACHGPSQQMNGFRLDRRSAAMKGGTRVVIVPGGIESSRLYLRLVSGEFGGQMPPSGKLPDTTIDIIKRWIEQGAEWPDDAAGETDAAPPDPRALRMLEALRTGNRGDVKRLLDADRKIANLRGRDGSTPLMYAALYSDIQTLRLLLEAGADPNLANQDGATPIMWAVDDAAKTALLLEHKAQVDAAGDDKKTPLIIAAARAATTPVIRLLLDHGANPNARSANNATPLQQTAGVGNHEAMRLLIERGAALASGGLPALNASLLAGCRECVDLLMDSVAKPDLTRALFGVAAQGKTDAVRLLLSRGADPNAKDGSGYTPLMRACHSDEIPVDVVRALIERGADVNVSGPAGETALGFAKMRGNTAVVQLLMARGAAAPPAAVSSRSAPASKPAASVRAAIQQALPIIQKADVNFWEKTGCVSCHHNSVAAMAVAASRKAGIRPDENVARRQRNIVAKNLDDWRDRMLRGSPPPGAIDTVGYILLGLGAENYQPDAAAEAAAYYLAGRQLPDGRWPIITHRPPIEASDFTVTATSIRGIRLYAPKADRARYDRIVSRAATWLRSARPSRTEERTMQLLGLSWAGIGKETLHDAASALLAEQRPDGGWSQLPDMESDAYATGQALVALQEAAGLSAKHTAVTRGIQFLLRTQLADGSWYVKTRSVPSQPLFDSGFPHGPDQWISAAATNWSTTALALSLKN